MTTMRPSVRIIADASHCPDTGAGGYAFQVNVGNRNYFRSGQLKKLMPTNGAAELASVVNSLAWVSINNIVRKGDKVIIFTDCKYVISRLAGQVMQTCSPSEKMHSVFNLIVKEFNLSVEIVHIKAHQPKLEIGAEGSVHNACDRAARKAMRQKRKTITTEGSLL